MDNIDYRCNKCNACHGKCCCNTGYYCCITGPAGPQGETGPIGPAGRVASAFGGYYMTDTGSLDLSSTPITVPLDLPSSSYNGVSFANPNAITVKKAGIYRIDVALYGRSLSSSTIGVQLAINNVAQTNTSQAQEFTTFELNSFVFSNFLPLAAGDQLSLLISSTSDTLFSMPQTGQTAGLIVQRVS